MAAKKDKKLEQIVQTLKAEFNPKKLFLFGSRANGNFRMDSDYDFVMVLDGKVNRSKSQMKARNLLHKKCNVQADIFIYDQSTFDEWKDELSSIPETAVNTGREIDLG